jgi:NADPH:quinone reductase-like Zn-dependent oxidoreductase
MKAARVHQWGSPEVITVESVDLPEPADEELLVRVHAAGVGPWDALVRSGKIAEYAVAAARMIAPKPRELPISRRRRFLLSRSPHRCLKWRKMRGRDSPSSE